MLFNALKTVTQRFCNRFWNDSRSSVREVNTQPAKISLRVSYSKDLIRNKRKQIMPCISNPLRKGYGQAFWMHHFNSLVKKYPDFVNLYNQKIPNTILSSYIRELPNKGDYFPTKRAFYSQIRHIIRKGKPLSNSRGCQKGTFWNRHPNHEMLMKKYKHLDVPDATLNYNNEIEKLRGASVPRVTISHQTMKRWRNVSHCTNVSHQNKEPQKSNVIPSILLKAHPKPDRSIRIIQVCAYPHKFWLYYLSEFIRRFPLFRRSGKCCSKDIAAYRNQVVESGDFPPSKGALYNHLKHIRRYGTLMSLEQHRYKHLPNHAQLMKKYSVFTARKAAQKYSEDRKQFYKIDNSALSVSPATMVQWRRKLTFQN